MKTQFIETLLLTFIIVITSCDDNRKTSIQTIEVKAETPTLLSKYKDIAFDSLDVYSGGMYNENFKYKGVLLDSMEVSFLPQEWKWEPNYYACYKFKINDSLTGLITRVPSHYDASAIKLFFYDIRKDSIVKTINLADIFGDAGDAFQYSTCIYKQNNNDFLALTYNWSAYDHSVGDDPNDTIIENWYNYSLIDISKNLGDTITKDSSTIVNKYAKTIERLASY
jgi:hypothetical protein